MLCEFIFSNSLKNEIHVWPGIIVFLIIMIVSVVVRNRKLKKANEAIRRENVDEKLIRSLEKKKRRCIFNFKQTQQLHDTLCTYLCAMYLQKNDLSNFFSTMNAFKTTETLLKRQVYQLLLCYFIDKGFYATGDLLEQYSADADDRVACLLRDYGVQLDAKFQQASEHITNETVKEILRSIPYKA